MLTLGVVGAVLLGRAATPDEPYVEIVPDRYTYEGEREVWGWGIIPAPCCAEEASGTAHGVLLRMSGGELLLSRGAASPRQFVKVAVAGPPIGRNASLITGADGVPRGAATPAGVLALRCELGAASPTCAARAVATAAFGPVHAVATVPAPANASGTVVAFVASDAGLSRVEMAASDAPAAVTLVIDRAAASGSPASTDPAMTAVTASAQLVAAGNSVKLWLLEPSGTIRSWSWVTAAGLGAGGVYDDAVSTMALDAAGDLYVGNDIALNVRAASDGGVTRIAGEQGLPYANITQILTGVTDPVGGSAQLWLGTAMGLAIRSSDPAADPPWRYLYGPRWHPGKAVTALVADKTVGSPAGTVFAATDAGVVFLEQQLWTLEKKAAVMQAALARHDRHGLTAECALPSPGNLSDCDNGRGQSDSDNNGLWTSLVVGAEFFRYAVTKSDEAAQSAAHFLEGMQRLHDVTATPGLYARSLCANTDVGPRRSCAPNRGTDYTGPCGHPPGKCPADCAHCGLQWRNSTAKGYEGWAWKSDTSSDESVGHFFAFSLAAQLAPTAAARKAAAATLGSMIDYMIAHGGNLQDWTGQPTTWGRWSPNYVNGWRDFSDERGLQSLQVLAFLEAARNASVLTGAPPPPAWEEFRQDLINSTNGYEENMNNLKIQAPCDDNYSDDELTFMPYYTILACTRGLPERGAAALKSMTQTWKLLRAGRSNFWAAIFMAMTGTREASDVSAMVWTLRTWPLELITWPMTNSHRLDIVRTGVRDRFGKQNSATRVLPANERGQGRWNGAPRVRHFFRYARWFTMPPLLCSGSPFDVSDNGDPSSEMDPGAWLLPYWMARYHGLLAAPQ